MAYPEVWRIADVGHERVDQGGFTNTGFPANQDDLAISTLRLSKTVVERVQFDLSPHHERSRATRKELLHRFGRRVCLGAFLDTGNKTITSATDGLNGVLIASAIANCLAGRTQTLMQGGVTDK